MIDKAELYQNLNRGILEERYPAFERNLRKNLPLIKEFGGLERLISKAGGKHAIVIGAGPSLEKDIRVLKKYQHRQEIVLIAADMALRPLVQHGVSPAVVFSCETTPVDYFSGIDTRKMWLAAFSCASNVNVRKWRGDISFYNWMIDSPEYDPLWERAGNELGSLATGNIITTQAIAFAMGSGILSLSLVGNDLGFSDTYFVRGAVSRIKRDNSTNRFNSREKDDYSIIRRVRGYEVRRGEELFYTNHQFLAAKLWIEELVRGQNVPVYDSSLPGCSGEGITRIELNDIFRGLFTSKKKKRRRR